MSVTSTAPAPVSSAPDVVVGAAAGSGPLSRKVDLRDLQLARDAGIKLPMLTCYDATTASVMQQEGVPLLLVGDSAAMTILGHPSTVHINQTILDELGAGVRRGAPLAYLVVDMAFGTYHGSADSAVETVAQTVRASGCDAVKLEVADSHAPLVSRLADMGVSVWAHIGLRPQSAQVSGYRTQGRTAEAARDIVNVARQMMDAGATCLLLEAVPPEVSRAVVEGVGVPTIGCGAGPAPMAHVVVLQDLLGLSPRRPRFVPDLGEDLSLRQAVRRWSEMIRDRSYPSADHVYAMLPEEAERFTRAAAG